MIISGKKLGSKIVYDTILEVVFDGDDVKCKEWFFNEHLATLDHMTMNEVCMTLQGRQLAVAWLGGYSEGFNRRVNL